MVLSKSELIGSLKHEVRVLVHLAGKVEPSMVDYRPTPKQRSTIELLRYLTMMGPTLVKVAQAGTFDPAAPQLFLYLKACGRDELKTMNLWAGVDG